MDIKANISYLKEVLAALRAISDETGAGMTELFVGFADTALVSRALLWEYKLMRLYKYPRYVRRGFLSYRRCVRVSNRLIGGASEEELDKYRRKECFNRTFGDYVRRDWLYLPESTEEQIRAFCGRNSVFLAKEIGSTQGQNITLHRAGEYDMERFISDYAGKTYVLEAFVKQHPDLARLNPTSVNTVRLVTAGVGGDTEIIGGCLRCGGAGAFVDNFHSGGVAYPLELTTGMVTGAGRSFDGKMYLRHPSTGCPVPGFQVPFWDELVRAVLEAAGRVPSVGYVGWDVAITEQGVEFIEGNVDIPDHTLIQMDLPDAYTRLSRFAEKHGISF